MTLQKELVAFDGVASLCRYVVNDLRLLNKEHIVAVGQYLFDFFLIHKKPRYFN
jgi:hypothetical protein